MGAPHKWRPPVRLVQKTHEFFERELSGNFVLNFGKPPTLIPCGKKGRANLLANLAIEARPLGRSKHAEACARR